MINVGDAAPNFTLKNTAGEDVSLEQFKGDKNVLVLFFPLAFSSVCTEELCSTRDNMKLYDSLNAEVLGISIDSFFTLKEFKASQNLNFNLLSDFNKGTATDYGVLNTNFFGMNGVANRSAFVVDKEGVVQYAEVNEDASVLPNFSAISEVLQNLN